MSVLSPKRVLFVAATALFAAGAFASNPSPRTFTRAAYDAQAAEIIVFGGQSAYDTGTAMTYDSNETWAWTGARWVQRFPAHSPSGRTAHMMTYDSTRGRIVLFGGRQGTGTTTGESRALGDTWIYDNNDWTQLNPPSSPSARQLSGMAYDPIRDRVVLYGGLSVADDGLTVTALYDTWEFDGTTWTKVNEDNVKIGRPMLAYDAARSQMILVGIDTEFKTHMYRLENGSWAEITPEKLPDCVNESGMVYQDHTGTIILVGGVCPTTTTLTDKTWEWNGTTWAEVKTSDISRGNGMAIAYDSLRRYVFSFGGSDSFTAKPRSTAFLYRNNNWSGITLAGRPTPRSLFTLTGDPVAKTVWLMGGLNEYSGIYEADFWGYRGGQWFEQTVKDPPPNCDAPMAAFDTDRNKLVMACWTVSGTNIDTYEFDSTAGEFKLITAKNSPAVRRQGAMAYDPTLKKTVLFGGFDGTNFRDDTWTWDGTNWTEVKKDKPPNRSLHAMWYDPLQKKVIIYGGIGRESIDERSQRFSDMWAFNGSGWTKLNVSTTPGERLGAQYAVDPASGKLLLFGGLVSVLPDPNKPTSRIQFYDNETWQWDGGASTWTKLSPANVPAARQNGRLTYDTSTNRLMLFGGYAGFYFSDVWYWSGSNWQVSPDLANGRRRATGPVPPQTPD